VKKNYINRGGGANSLRVLIPGATAYPINIDFTDAKIRHKS
jgi:hypothetical protein